MAEYKVGGSGTKDLDQSFKPSDAIGIVFGFLTELGAPNDRPPTNLTKRPEEEEIRDGRRNVVNVGKEIGLHVIEATVFGFQPLGEGDEIPPEQRFGVEAPATEHAVGGTTTLPQPGLLPMWKADP